MQTVLFYWYIWNFQLYFSIKIIVGDWNFKECSQYFLRKNLNFYLHITRELYSSFYLQESMVQEALARQLHAQQASNGPVFPGFPLSMYSNNSLLSSPTMVKDRSDHLRSDNTSPNSSYEQQLQSEFNNSCSLCHNTIWTTSSEVCD